MATKEEGAAKEAAKQSVNLQLMPANGSDQPVLDFGWLNGRLAARVAISYEALGTLHQQIGGVLQAVSRRQKADAR